MRRLILLGVLAALQGCKPDIQPSAVPLTSTVTGRQAPCESMSVHGFPALLVKRTDTFFLCRPGSYAVNVDPVKKTPIWVAYRLDAERFAPPPRPAAPGVLVFRADPLLPSSAQAKPDDFVGVGYLSGQLVDPAAFSVDIPSVASTFYLSVVAPLDDRASASVTAINLRFRQWAASHPLHVVVGPIYGPVFSWVGQADKKNANNRQADKGRLAVPNAFFFAAFDLKAGKSIAFLVPNDAAGEKIRIVSVAAIEDATGLRFTPDLPLQKQADLKSAPNLSDWPVPPDN